MIVARAWARRRYGVFGLARTGRSVLASLSASGAEVWAWDDAEAARAGVDGLVDLNTAELAGLDGLVVSPGVPLNRWPLAGRAREAGVPVIGDVELFALARGELPDAAVVGITGTNGKSTCAALLHHMLVVAGREARLGGNIGAPILGEAPLGAGGVYVLELSSFQIDLTVSLACDVAVLLNVTPDHLDRYDGFEAYAAAKARLFAMQRGGGVAVVAVDDAPTRAVAGRLDGCVAVSGVERLARGVSVVAGTATVDGVALGAQAGWSALAGPHNAQNAAAAIACARALGLSEGEMLAGLETYPGLPHRMEIVAERGGVRFVNDSKATNPASVAPALAAFPGGIRWIAGGRAKADGLGALVDRLEHVRGAYLIGEAEAAFADALGGRVPITRAGTLAVAVAAAAADAVAGETVLLAPACASYDQFRDYEDRGDAFRRAVIAL